MKYNRLTSIKTKQKPRIRKWTESDLKNSTNFEPKLVKYLNEVKILLSSDQELTW